MLLRLLHRHPGHEWYVLVYPHQGMKSLSHMTCLLAYGCAHMYAYNLIFIIYILAILPAIRLLSKLQRCWKWTALGEPLLFFLCGLREKGRASRHPRVVIHYGLINLVAWNAGFCPQASQPIWSSCSLFSQRSLRQENSYRKLCKSLFAKGKRASTGTIRLWIPSKR